MNETKPWELRRDFTVSPGIRALQNQAKTTTANHAQTMRVYNFSQHLEQFNAITQNAASTILGVQSSIQQMSSALLPIVDTVNTAMRSFWALQEAAEGINRIGSTFTEIADTVAQSFPRFETRMDKHHISSIRHLANTINHLGAYNVASSFKEISSTIGESLIDLPDFIDVEPYEELTPEEIDAELQKQIEIDKKILGDQVPYNVLSNDFIANVYLPVLGIANTLESAETFDATFATHFILFSLIPLIYYFIINQNQTK